MDMAEINRDQINNRKPSEVFKGRINLGELQEINDNPHWFSIFERICDEIDEGLSVKELKTFLKKMRKMCD